MLPMSAHQPLDRNLTKIENQLTDELERSQRANRVNSNIAFCLSAVAVLASILAGLSVAAQWFSKTTLVVLSSLPGAVLVVTEKFKFEDRSAWHRKRSYGLRSLLYQLQFEAKPQPEVSAAWRKLNDEMLSLWPGSLSKGPKKTDAA
jgi:hypothetical protein